MFKLLIHYIARLANNLYYFLNYLLFKCTFQALLLDLEWKLFYDSKDDPLLDSDSRLDLSFHSFVPHRSCLARIYCALDIKIMANFLDSLLIKIEWVHSCEIAIHPPFIDL